MSRDILYHSAVEAEIRGFSITMEGFQSGLPTISGKNSPLFSMFPPNYNLKPAINFGSR